MEGRGNAPFAYDGGSVSKMNTLALNGDGTKRRRSTRGTVRARTKALREITDKAIAKGITPLEVMLDNMRYYWKRAATVQEQLEAMTARTPSDDTTNTNASEDQELIALFEKHCDYRERAGAWAKEAAPYTVPKLATVKFGGNIQHDVKAIVATMSMEEAAAAYADEIKKIDNAQLLPIDAIEGEVVEVEGE